MNLGDKIQSMPISLSAKKSLRKSRKNKKDNVGLKTKVKKTVKDYLTKPSEKAFREVASLLDKSVKKGINHKNKVARLKSRLSKMKVAKVEVKKPVKKAKKKIVRKTSKKMS